MLEFDGTKQEGLRHPEMREYVKNPVPVTALQQSEPFSVKVSWQESPLDAQAGDWLVSDESSEWPVADEVFKATYQHVEGDLYVKTASIMAVQINEPFRVKTLEGLTTVEAGSWLVQGPGGEAWPIRQESFERTYQPA